MEAPDLSAVRDRFPALARTGPDGRPCAFLDAPGGTQVPGQVIEAISSYLRTSNANLHGAFETSRETDRVVEEARRAGADLLGADPGEIVFGPNATTLLFHLSRALAKELRPGDEVVVTRLDHDANVAPWLLAAEEAGARVRWVDVREEDVTLDEASFDAALEGRPRLVAFTLASNAVGTIPPAASLARRAREAGAVVICDAVHLAQHRPLDVRALGADVVVCSPYKVFGPHLGMLWARRELLEGWRAAKVRPAPDEPPARWETGTQSHEALAGWAAAVEYLADLGRTFARPAGPGRRAAVLAAFDAIARYESVLAERFLSGLEALPHVRLYGIADRRRLAERTPTFAVRVGSQHPAETAATLARRGIFVWDGNYYALAVMERLGLEATGGAVRVGFCHYATAEEVDRVLGELGALR
ncbi:MAG TPA: cysteine desulfurase-like protein [Actinomycetota bacterium]|nr:cysteine desulfurase-like protein [Actinomycetota bacterium]